MDAEPLTASRSPPSWQLADPVAAATQGFVVTGFGALPTGRALFLEFTWQGDKGPDGWLNRLLAVAPITSAVRPNDADVQTRAASIAFSGTGLRRMGLAEVALASFASSFKEGMFQEDRLRRLGDRRDGQWLGSVVDGGPVWSANTPLRAPTSPLPSGFEAPPVGAAEQSIPTEITVHALLLLYAKDEPAADAWAEHVRIQLLQDGVALVRGLKLLLDVENGGFSREHFGFADALSQPLPYDEANAVQVGGQPAKQDPIQGVPLGEFMFGHTNGHDEKAPGPLWLSTTRRARPDCPTPKRPRVLVPSQRDRVVAGPIFPSTRFGIGLGARLADKHVGLGVYPFRCLAALTQPGNHFRPYPRRRTRIVRGSV
jgi:hypothetical protein